MRCVRRRCSFAPWGKPAVSDRSRDRVELGASPHNLVPVFDAMAPRDRCRGCREGTELAKIVTYKERCRPVRGRRRLVADDLGGPQSARWATVDQVARPSPAPSVEGDAPVAYLLVGEYRRHRPECGRGHMVRGADFRFRLQGYWGSSRFQGRRPVESPSSMRAASARDLRSEGPDRRGSRRLARRDPRSCRVETAPGSHVHQDPRGLPPARPRARSPCEAIPGTSALRATASHLGLSFVHQDLCCSRRIRPREPPSGQYRRDSGVASLRSERARDAVCSGSTGSMSIPTPRFDAPRCQRALLAIARALIHLPSAEGGCSCSTSRPRDSPRLCRRVLRTGPIDRGSRATLSCSSVTASTRLRRRRPCDGPARCVSVARLTT